MEFSNNIIAQYSVFVIETPSQLSTENILSYTLLGNSYTHLSFQGVFLSHDGSNLTHNIVAGPLQPAPRALRFFCLQLQLFTEEKKYITDVLVTKSYSRPCKINMNMLKESNSFQATYLTICFIFFSFQPFFPFNHFLFFCTQL